MLTCTNLCFYVFFINYRFHNIFNYCVSLTQVCTCFGQILENLKVLNLSHSQKLKKSPNFTKLPNLEQLKLKNCTALSSLHPSIGQLCKVHLINLQNCTNLSSLPTSIYNLHSLQTFIISGCSKIDRLHDDLGHLESLTTLLADRTAISHIPFSIVKLKKLTDLSLCGCNSRSGYVNLLFCNNNIYVSYMINIILN